MLDYNSPPGSCFASPYDSLYIVKKVSLSAYINRIIGIKINKMSDQERPNPITKAANTASSNLPRQARARVDLTNDPIPPGKMLEAEPKHHFNLYPESHDQPNHATATEGDASLVKHGLPGMHKAEVDKMHDDTQRHAAFDRSQMDWQGTSTSSNKKMMSNHIGADFDKHTKHLDSVRRSVGKSAGKKNATQPHK